VARVVQLLQAQQPACGRQRVARYPRTLRPFGQRCWPAIAATTGCASSLIGIPYNQTYGSAEAFAAGAAEAGASDGQQQLLLPRQLNFGSNSSTAVSVPSMRVWLWRWHGFGRSLCRV
jgi:hypothetical protein